LVVFEVWVANESLSSRDGARRFSGGTACYPRVCSGWLIDLIGKAPGDGFESGKEKAVSSSSRTFI
jgi:hypothetical protein